VGRTQTVVFFLHQLISAGKLPDIPIFVDSPMAINVADIFCRHPEDHNLEMAELMDEKRCPLCCKQYHLTRTASESKALNHLAGPLVIIAGLASYLLMLVALGLAPEDRELLQRIQARVRGWRGRAG
jgi:metallo-beta-lactamase family protein